MKSQHVDPEEAVQIHIDIKAKNSLGIHWGTFALAYEVRVHTQTQPCFHSLSLNGCILELSQLSDCWGSPVPVLYQALFNVERFDVMRQLYVDVKEK